MCASRYLSCLVTLFKRKHYNEETELQEKIEKFRDYLELGCKNLLIITTPILDGYEIEEYLGVQSAEIVQEPAYSKIFLQVGLIF
ncbi:hypothetical protein [Paraclostridium sordellii]|uniref:hypothetical protein n=1 Tax=Paraclostridium sordellii TaxID=1505 RepID=UPI0012D8466D|nr:hypothetical protein [Paeniclostridium sordellii]